MTDCKPRREGRFGIPMCDEDNCPSYDGKRCRLSGFRPSEHCEVALAADYERMRGMETTGHVEPTCPTCLAGDDCRQHQGSLDERCCEFERGEPDGHCETDGHFACAKCKHASLSDDHVWTCPVHGPLHAPVCNRCLDGR